MCLCVAITGMVVLSALPLPPFLCPRIMCLCVQVTGMVVQGLSIMVFVSDNEASQHAVNLAVALARPGLDSVHVMHACTNEGSTPDAQKLMARCTQGLGPTVNSEVMVRHRPPSPTPALLAAPTPATCLIYGASKDSIGNVHWKYAVEM